ncbi:hypothetical protein Cs7R123_62930 [Catellatospora sp. TT07R-123]|uniref:hypothetical protein n=1 Tax=Catellatospora sp. TT07R-123 TaxID=2733863 RepID=UPI001B110CE4|nr:hypothetical protein [Catellatospora sp. TT07R-123]GHJ48951.1 hypothetical protein Cs7R123_62930 [Catellatospora sp. TT07R-123]
MWGDGGVYGAWAQTMDRWARSEPIDPSALPPLAPEYFDAGTWARLADRITTAVSERLITWAGVTSRSLGAAGDEFATARALTQARTGLRAVRAMAVLPQLPEELRTRLLALVDEQVREAQRQLERQAAADLGGRDRRFAEQRLRTIRDNGLTAVLAEAPAPSATDGWLGATTPPRRIVDPG